MNFKSGFRRIAKVLSIICTVLFIFFQDSYWYKGKLQWRFTDFTGVEPQSNLLLLTVGILIAPLTYYAYIGLEKLFLWVKDGFTKD